MKAKAATCVERGRFKEQTIVRFGASTPCTNEQGCGSLWRLAVVLLLTGYLLVAHGCHGDEDNELLGLAPALSETAGR
jgi:hypothetical protein